MYRNSVEMEEEDVDPEDYRRCMREDLQLAAELGKTLLERNKDLENTLRQQQTLVDDQAQEIEYLTKQTAALREVNDSRLRIYEQLEVSIQELERNNQRLAVENAADKKQIKSLCHSLDAMEGRCEELTRTLEELQAAERRRKRASVIVEGQPQPQGQQGEGEQTTEEGQEVVQDEHDEDMAAQVAMLRAQKDRETRRAEELEEQLTALIQENAGLEEQMSAYRMREEQLRSLEEELSSMQGQQYCYRCLRRSGGPGTGAGASTATPSLMDEDLGSSVMEDEASCCFDDDDDTEVQSIASETHNTVLSDNPYRVLVEKYEALLSMQRRPARQRPGSAATLQACRSGTASPGGPLMGRLCSSPLPPPENNCLSLQEELQLSGEFSSGPVSLMLDDFTKVEEGEPQPRPDKLLRAQVVGGAGQPYFSEAETNSSSGVSEGEVPPRQQHAATQTDLMSGGGKLLWSITAGSTSDSPVVNVYGDQTGILSTTPIAAIDPTESRFQRAPEYRELFSEIFSVLKRSVARSSAAAANSATTPTSGITPSLVEKVAEKKEKKKRAAEHKNNGFTIPEEPSDEGARNGYGGAKPKHQPEPEVSGQASLGEADAGQIEEINRDIESPSPSSILSLSGQPRKSRKTKGRRERKAEQLRRKVLALSPERREEAFREEQQQIQQQSHPHTSRDQSPAVSERSNASSKKGGRHWAKRGRPLALTGPAWPWNRNQQPPGPSPLALSTTTNSASSSNSQRSPPAMAAGPSIASEAPKAPPPPINFTSSASADVARLRRLEKSYAEALRTTLPKNPRRK